MLLATDLDGTFLGGNRFEQLQLYRLIRTNLNVRLVFVTGRGLDTVIPLLNDPVLPDPDYIICDVGATIVNGHTLEPVHPLQSEIERRWPGHVLITDALKDIEGIFYQEVPQHRRCSYLMEDILLLAEVRTRVERFNCEIVYSAGQFLDVLPAGVNKGSSLQQLVNFLGIKESDVLVAGDTLNDLAMYQCGFKGVVVGNAEPKLVEVTKGLDNICYAEAEGAGGILEAIAFFPGLAKSLKTPDEQYVPPAIPDIK